MVFLSWRRLLHFCSRTSFGKDVQQKQRSCLVWRCYHKRTSGRHVDPELRMFLEQNTEIIDSGNLTPEIRLHLLTPNCRFWHDKAALWPYGEPYWAMYWPGGQGLSRYLLDNPKMVQKKKVLDLGSGCGATAIAATLSGASQVVANDIDPVAAAAIVLNCELNNIDPIPVLTENLIGTDIGKWDLIVLGDMFYNEELADSLSEWLKKCIQDGHTELLIGDPGRPYFVTNQFQRMLHKVSEYALPKSSPEEYNGSTKTFIWNYQP
ncbi:electron transfer flavoprotein beta subunit lysine methyltransferase [Crotalus tigris]|nr:electron transfer flavoprotein beta subunit lysine methyltransferase [Crotalus tigris]XP_039189014.1 electron transfer flavoprotein beta subunit lysine methyltransferase [Crotalus tigris]XP_039189020.1 electron transfer flavoprotein beta subunit lysine methyltransferase [Crotalus tigris]XP_039189025.1 electron transfer flavoprotein beta subunit lysine methyltransferase [Crotalus tigris]XP_039189037.1 electron transfer flavoprotein beta subunit lysine methyltransferase [Crotalus tigris]